MKRKFWMKKCLVLFLSGIFFMANGQVSQDSVIMVVAGKQVALSEFLFIAQKNGTVDLSSEEELKGYVELFKNFKLKVTEAEALGMDTTEVFIREYEDYKKQLLESVDNATVRGHHQEKENAEMLHLLQEYKDGSLLFEISSKRIWSKPVADQQLLEEEWLKELNEKYPTDINWDLLRKIQQ